MDGYEVARWLKSRPSWRTIPLIAVTALAMVGDRDKLLATGFDGYIAKPIAPETFVTEVEGFLKFSSPVPASSFSQSAPQPSPSPSRSMTLLVVDNQPINLTLARSIFEPFGYAVLLATNAQEALTVALQAVPDLILSDVHMGEGSGYDFIQAVKAHPQLKEIPTTSPTGSKRKSH